MSELGTSQAVKTRAESGPSLLLNTLKWNKWNSLYVNISHIYYSLQGTGDIFMVEKFIQMEEFQNVLINYVKRANKSNYSSYIKYLLF